MLSFEFHANVRHLPSLFFWMLLVCRRNVIRSNSSNGSTSNRLFFNMWALLHLSRAKFRNWRYYWSCCMTLKPLETWISFSHSKLNFRIKISGNWRCSRRTKIHRPKWHRPSKRTSSLRSNELIEATLSFGAWCPKLAMTSSLNLVNPLSSMDTDCEAEITNTLLTCFTIHRLKYGRSIRNAWKDPLKSHPVNTLLASVRFTLYRIAFHFRSISIDAWWQMELFLYSCIVQGSSTTLVLQRVKSIPVSLAKLALFA